MYDDTLSHSGEMPTMSKQFSLERGLLATYVETLSNVLRRTSVTDGTGKDLPVDHAIETAVGMARNAHDGGNKLIFAGNGGSAGIASHMATDYSKNGGLRAWAMNDGSMLTCLGNDYGYEYVFAKQIEFHARSGDLLIAISSSGRSANILNAVRSGREMGCDVVTLSGFSPDNPLRETGNINFYVNSELYGYVEVGHLILCHAILDHSMGLVV